jgi:DNA-binding Xre family transcriptional regulator
MQIVYCQWKRYTIRYEMGVKIMPPAETVNIDRGKLTVALAKKNFSSQRLADETGITRTTISRIRNGRAKSTRKTLDKISRALEVDPRELLEGTENIGSNQLSHEESHIIFLFRELDQRGKGDATRMIESLSEGAEESKDVVSIIRQAKRRGATRRRTEKTG